MNNQVLKTITLLLLALLLTGCVLVAPSPEPIEIQPSPSVTVESVFVQPTQIQATIPPKPTATFLPSALPVWTETAQPAPTSGVLPTNSVAGSLKVYFFDVGQGDSTLIVSSDGQTALIDGGDSGTGVVQYLRNLGIQRIDLMFATHPHADHIGGLVDVLNAFPVAKVVTSGQFHTTSVFENFLDGIDRSGAEYVEVGRGDTVPFGNITFQVLSPANNSPDNLNNGSLVLKFQYGNTSFLMMGDAEKEIEAELTSSGQPVDADILKVGHHGSKSSSSPSFLSAVSPETAVYFAGAGNSYGHPAPETVAALTSAGATVYGTDQLGTIMVTVSPDGYQVSSVRQQPAATAIVVAPGLPTASPVPGGLIITSVTSPVNKGGSATLTAQAAPGAACNITVYYKSGPSKAQGLEPKTANSDGEVRWDWKVGVKTTSGNWRIEVSCTANGNTSTQETTFTVQ